MISPAALLIMAQRDDARSARLMRYLGSPVPVVAFGPSDESEPGCRLNHSHYRRDGRMCAAELCWLYTSAEASR